MVKIYTRTGDNGETGLADGTRVSKDERHIHAVGELDELNAALGTIIVQITEPSTRELLVSIQRDLFALGARLARSRTIALAVADKAVLTQAHVARLEEAIDTLEAQLTLLRNFILPGGSPTGAALHLARAICRRAERSVVALADVAPVEPIALAYLNRLGDLLFVLARAENKRQGSEEEKW
jgi:cob(I)alamin adenosyltransferase